MKKIPMTDTIESLLEKIIIASMNQEYSPLERIAAMRIFAKQALQLTVGNE